MIPYIQGDLTLITASDEITGGTLTWYVDLDKGRITTEIDGLESLIQSIRFRLLTQSDLYEIYSEEYGLPISDLLSQNIPLAYSLIASAIEETLLKDDRVEAVGSFIFDTDMNDVTVSFTVDSVYGTGSVNEVVISG